MQTLKAAWDVVRLAVLDFFEDEATTLGAALAFYTALSFAPLIVLLITVTTFLGDDVRQQLLGQVRNLMGPKAGEMVTLVVQSADERRDLRTFAGLVGLASLALSAAGVMGQLQFSLNRIWGVRAKAGQGVGGWLRKRLLSFAMLIGAFLVLLLSLLADAILSAVLGGIHVIWPVVSLLLSLAVFTALFALLFRYLPDVEMAWRDVWVGALVTALLFTIGKAAVSLYLGNSSVGSAYGAAGSLLVLLVWVYYSSLIFFFGAELTQAAARRFGKPIAPNEHAVWLERGAEYS